MIYTMTSGITTDYGSLMIRVSFEPNMSETMELPTLGWAGKAWEKFAAEGIPSSNPLIQQKFADVGYQVIPEPSGYNFLMYLDTTIILKTPARAACYLGRIPREERAKVMKLLVQEAGDLLDVVDCCRLIGSKRQDLIKVASGCLLSVIIQD